MGRARQGKLRATFMQVRATKQQRCASRDRQRGTRQAAPRASQRALMMHTQAQAACAGMGVCPDAAETGCAAHETADYEAHYGAAARAGRT